MSETTNYVLYCVASLQRGPQRLSYVDTSSKESNALASLTPVQQQAIIDFIQERNPQSQILENYLETPDTKRTAKWPQLHRALETCKQRSATLLIVELGTLTSNENFTQILLDSQVKFHCLDQPFVNQTILEALSKHAEVQRKLHGKLIREGLKMTSAKSGNPNAAEVISKVNKPKIDTAIVFAMLLQPIIQDYRNKGYSQRQMVKALNDEGFTAPEGGKWVLSQLQKVLDRVRLNEIALEVKNLLPNESLDKKASTELAEFLNSKGIAPLKRGQWDETQANKLLDRLEQIQDIIHINSFVLNLLPILHHYRGRNLSAVEILREFHHAGIPIRHDLAAA